MNIKLAFLLTFVYNKLVIKYGLWAIGMRVWRNWQTRKIQVLVEATLYRFKSCYPHHVGAKIALLRFSLYEKYPLTNC